MANQLNVDTGEIIQARPRQKMVRYLKKWRDGKMRSKTEAQGVQQLIQLFTSNTLVSILDGQQERLIAEVKNILDGKMSYCYLYSQIFV